MDMETDFEGDFKGDFEGDFVGDFEGDFGRIFQIETLILIKTMYLLFIDLLYKYDSTDNSRYVVLISRSVSTYTWWKLVVSCLSDLMISQLSYWLSTMNCNANEEDRRNREISRNIDRQIRIEKNKRENVRIALKTV